MPDRDDKSRNRRSLTTAGLARRRFLEGSALAAAGTSAALMPGSRAAAAEAKPDAAAATCAETTATMSNVEGKGAFITGGNSGIGLGIARAFVDAGMKVVITYRTQSHLDEAMKYLQSAGDRVHAISVDVTDRAAME